MPLTIETGMTVSGADSFASLAELSVLCIGYFGEALSGTDVHKEAALRRAFIYMSSLDWSASVWPNFGGQIPFNVKLAQVVFARAEMEETGVLSPQVSTSGRKVLTKVGNLSWSVVGDDASVEGSRPVLTMAMDLLRPYLENDPSKDRPVGLGMMSIGP